ASNIKECKVFARGQEATWVCRNCGYTHKGKDAPEVCLACAHPQAHFEIQAKNF
ncbi:MAG: rubrerythrin family protein, partial [Pseudomonadota bacterium]